MLGGNEEIQDLSPTGLSPIRVSMAIQLFWSHPLTSLPHLFMHHLIPDTIVALTSGSTTLSSRGATGLFWAGSMWPVPLDLFMQGGLATGEGDGISQFLIEFMRWLTVDIFLCVRAL